MPGKVDFAQPDLAAVTHREARRSDPTIPMKIGHASTRVQRPSMHAGSENVSIGAAGRRSPRVAASHQNQCIGASRLSRTAAGSRIGGERPTPLGVEAEKMQRRTQATGSAMSWMVSIGGEGGIMREMVQSEQDHALARAIDASEKTSKALNDITNVSGARQGYGKISKQALSGQASVPVPQLPLPPQAGCRQLSARDARSQGETQSHIPPPTASSSTYTGLQAHPVDAGVFEADAENTQAVSEYSPEIYNKFFKDEADFLPRADYMDLQSDINGKMRAILIDWLVEVHLKYRMRNETLFLTVNLIDRFLSRTANVLRKKLQLVGVVAMFIAAKFEEINPPEIQDFVHITDNAYTKEDVLAMECTMLTTLGFRIVGPTAIHFFERLQRVDRCDQIHIAVAEYLIELGLLDVRMLRYPPSHVVAAALLLSNELLGKRPNWPQAMVQHSRHTEKALRGCADELRELLEAAPKNQLQAVWKKFSLPQHHTVARMTFCST